MTKATLSLYDAPITLEPMPDETQEKRLWLGNLDPRVNEYQLIKIVQRFGPIEKFDLLFHRTGPLEGQPRGYAFVSYKDLTGALAAKNELNGAKIGTRHIAVKWAHTISTEDYEKSKVPDIPALAGAKEKPKVNKSSTIEAIEAKLRVMEQSDVEPDFTERPTLSEQPPVWRPPAPQRTTRVGRERHHDRRRDRPYSRSKWR